MCGIMGYIGPRTAQDVVLEGLRRLEYRGYDSAGIAVAQTQGLGFQKSLGKLAALRARLEASPLPGNAGIGHTRWATHGIPSEVNAHPHFDTACEISVVHNGIIENHRELRAWLEDQGTALRSETDTELLPHLIRHYYKGDLVEALRATMARLEGSYAVAVLSSLHPDRIAFARLGSPLVLGVGRGEHFIASDANALRPYTARVVYVEDGHCGYVSAGEHRVLAQDGRCVAAHVSTVNIEGEDAEKGMYPHFMLKEIHQQPAVVKHLIEHHVQGGAVSFPELAGLESVLDKIQQIRLVACGTAWHAGMVGSYLLERWARLPASAELASEFRYREPMIDHNTLVIAVSQSGETADTLQAVRIAHEVNAPVLGVVNAPGSSIARESGHIVYLHAGPEIGVASTKAYTAQVTVLTLLALYLGMRRKTLPQQESARLLSSMLELPDKMQRLLDTSDAVRALAANPKYGQAKYAMFLGRGVNFPSALEGALKLKEISYIHAEGYAAGEMKHGPIALVTDTLPVIAIAVESPIYAKTLSNIQEIRARNGVVLSIATEGDEEIRAYSEDVIYVPPCDEALSPLLVALPLQLLAYHAAVLLGCDVDQPRNLAKSVTVE